MADNETFDFNITDPIKQDQEITSFDYNVSNPIGGTYLDFKTAERRAEKYTKALPITLNEEDKIHITDSLQNGNDETVRQELLQRKIQANVENGRLQFEKMLSEGDVGLDQALNVLKTGDQLSTEDINTFLEKGYVSSEISDMFSSKHNPDYEPPGQSEVSKINAMGDFLSIREIAMRIREDLHGKFKAMGYPQFFGELALSGIPFATSYIQGKKEAIKGPGDIFLGENLDKQFEKIWSMSPEQAAQTLKSRVEEISKISDTAALDYIQKFLEGGSAERGLDNIFSGLDFSLLSGIPAAGIRRMVNGISMGGSSAANGAGNVAEAAYREARMRLFSQVQTDIPNRSSFFTFMGSLPTIANPQSAIGNGATSLSMNGAARILETLQRNAARVIDYTLNNADSLSTFRLEGNALDQAVQEARNLASSHYPSINNSIINVEPRWSPLTKSHYADIVIGDRFGNLFSSEAQANAMARNFFGLSEYEVKSFGGPYGIVMSKPLDETLPSVLDAYRYHIQTNSPTPQSLANSYLSFLRSNDYTLSTKTNTILKKATYGASNIQDLMKNLVEPLRLSKQSQRDFLSFVERQKLHVEPGTDRVGRFSADANEFEQEWFSMFRRMPTEAEHQAYASYKLINDADDFIRNLSILQDFTRRGLQNYSFNYGNLKWKPNKQPDIQGKLVDSLPWELQSERPFGILVINPDGTTRRVSSGDRNTFKSIQTLLGNGDFHILNITKFGEDTLRSLPMMNVPEGAIDYVLVPRANNLRSSNLNMRMYTRQEGYHMILDDNTYMISQATVRREGPRIIYYGDRNIVQAMTERQARNISEAFERIRPILASVHEGTRPVEDLRDALRTNGIPFGARDLLHQVENGHIDVTVPFLYRKKNQSLEEAHKISTGYGPGFVRHADDPHNPLKGSDLSFALEKGEPINRFVQSGTSGGLPVFNVQPARYLDPLGTIERSTSTLLKNEVLKDVRADGAIRFVEEFQDVLKGNIHEMRRNPLQALEKGDFNKNVTDRNKLQAAMNYRRSLLEFMNIKGDYERKFEYLQQRLADSVFERFGDRGVNVLGNIERHIETNPVRFLRAASVNLKFGFYNIGQLFMQSQGFTHVAAVEGVPAAGQASMAYTLMKYGNGSRDVNLMNQLGTYAQNVGWGSKNHFIEMYQEAHSSGFLNIAGSYAGIDNYLNPTLFRSSLGQVLDHSKVFFKLGEEFTRHTAYAAAYARWRNANPTAAFDKVAKEIVLNRADFLSVHMSSASNAAWNKGFLSVPTQFMQYQWRLMEQIWGAPLTTAERMHILGTYGLVYGVPVGVGGVLAGGIAPVHESIKQYALEKGIDFDENLVYKTFNDGLGSIITEFLVGSKQNVSERFGPGGNSIFRDLIQNARGLGSKTYVEVLAGAGGNTAYNAFKSMHPLVYSFWRTVADKDPWPLQAEDFSDVIREISSLNNATKAMYAVSLGKYYTKQGSTIIDDATWIEGLMTGLLGTVPERVDKFYDIIAASGELKKAKREAESLASIQYERALNAFEKGDEEAGTKFLKKAQIYMAPLDYNEQSKIFKKVIEKNLKQADSLEFSYATKNHEYWKTYFKKFEGKK